MTINKANCGLTLLELMIAAGILLVAISGLIASSIRLFSLNENSRKLTMAITAVQGKMEEIRNSDFASLYATYNATAFDPTGFPSSEAKGSIYVNDANYLVEVCVSVSWRERSNRIIGEDINLNGILDGGEDLNLDNKLSSPAEIVTLMGPR